ncbi:hypothetical protein QQ045_022313 [Rhodiola kirilowii]
MTLHKRRILKRDQDLTCVLCRFEQETTDHMLIHCDWSWRLWASCFSWWGSEWVMPQTVICLLESWEAGGMTKAYNRYWKTMCYAIIWSIWEERNKRCFQDQRRSVVEVGDLVKTRVAWWAKFRNSKCPYSVSTIKRCIEEVRENS